MAQRSITSGGINGGYDVGGSQTIINYLKSVMVAGNKINVSDVNSLISLWNNFNGHTHSISDLYGIYNYGNTNPPGYSSSGSFENDTSNGPNLSGDIGAVSSGGTITAAKINELISAMSGQANHSHTWNDRAS